MLGDHCFDQCCNMRAVRVIGFVLIFVFKGSCSSVEDTSHEKSPLDRQQDVLQYDSYISRTMELLQLKRSHDWVKDLLPVYLETNEVEFDGPPVPHPPPSFPTRDAVTNPPNHWGDNLTVSVENPSKLNLTTSPEFPGPTEGFFPTRDENQTVNANDQSLSVGNLTVIASVFSEENLIVISDVVSKGNLTFATNFFREGNLTIISDVLSDGNLTIIANLVSDGTLSDIANILHSGRLVIREVNLTSITNVPSDWNMSVRVDLPSTSAFNLTANADFPSDWNLTSSFGNLTFMAVFNKENLTASADFDSDGGHANGTRSDGGHANGTRSDGWSGNLTTIAVLTDGIPIVLSAGNLTASADGLSPSDGNVTISQGNF